MACRTRTACLLFCVLCASFLGGVLSKPRAYAPSAPWKRLPQSQSKAVGNAILGRSGLRFSASAGGVQYALNTVLPVVIKQFAVGQRIPDISGSEDHIDYTISGITIRQLSFSNIAAPVLFNGFQVSVTGISVQVAGSWSASCCCVFGHCLGTDGDFTATTGNAQMSLAGDVLSTADGHPELVLSSVSMDLGSLDIDISGSMFSGLYNLIVGLIKGSIESAAEGAIANAVQSQALSLINQQLAQFPTTFKIPDSPFPLQIDFRLLANASWPFKTSEVPYVAVGMYGSFENPASPQPVVLPTMRPHVLPEGAPLNNYMAQVDVDEYMVNTAFFLQFKEMPVDESVYNGDLPIFPLTTATFANVLPEFAKLYPSYTILWRFTENDTPQFFANANSSFASATFNWTWAVSNDPNPDVHKKVYTNAFTLNASISLTTALSFDNHDPRNPAVAFKATPASVFVDLVWSVDALGPFSTTALNAFVQAVVPSLPLSLSRSFPLPTIQCAFLTDPTIVNNDGYVSVLANLKYTGPPPSTGQCPTP